MAQTCLASAISETTRSLCLVVNRQRLQVALVCSTLYNIVSFMQINCINIFVYDKVPLALRIHPSTALQLNGLVELSKYMIKRILNLSICHLYSNECENMQLTNNIIPLQVFLNCFTYSVMSYVGITYKIVSSVYLFIITCFILDYKPISLVISTYNI